MPTDCCTQRCARSLTIAFEPFPLLQTTTTFTTTTTTTSTTTSTSTTTTTSTSTTTSPYGPIAVGDAGFDQQAVPDNEDEEYALAVWKSAPAADFLLRDPGAGGNATADNNVAFLLNAANGGGLGIFQDVAGATFEPGTMYTLSADVARDPLLNYASNTSLELREGAAASRRRAVNDPVAVRTVSVDELPTNGSAARFAVSFSVLAGSGLAGLPVRIALAFSGSGQTFFVDNVQLVASPAAPTTTTTTPGPVTTLLPPSAEDLPLADPSFEMQTVADGSSALYAPGGPWAVPATANLRLSNPNALDAPAAAADGNNVANIVNAATVGQGVVQTPPGSPLYEAGYEYLFSLAAAQDASVTYDSVLLIGFLADDGTVLASTLIAAPTSDYSRATATLTVLPSSPIVGNAVRVFISAAGTGPSYLFDNAALGRLLLPTTTTTTTAPPPNATYTFAVYHRADDVLASQATADTFLANVEAALADEGIDTAPLAFSLLSINDFPWIAVEVSGPKPVVDQVQAAVRR